MTFNSKKIRLEKGSLKLNSEYLQESCIRVKFKSLGCTITASEPRVEINDIKCFLSLSLSLDTVFLRTRPTF